MQENDYQKSRESGYLQGEHVGASYFLTWVVDTWVFSLNLHVLYTLLYE